ncbi:hypothetical protein BsIDN1_53040 [Bacillus safensis]|uniref:Uncharacterized protein n=1 Tax=Bacillus safensis TaxID=561879 RepID=A0A5S9MJ94_BACIA|nr:hypothetical protein BsIDN1_53040 [Bacillus safensis]
MTDTLGLVHTGWVGGIMVLIAAILTMISYQMEQKEQTQTI